MRLLQTLLLALTMLASSAHADTPASVLPGQAPESGNPILPGYYADPSIVVDDGTYYLYATIDPWGGEGLACWSTTDFVNWTFHDLNWPTKAACSTPDSSDAMVWAPSVVKGTDGRFYMYVSVGSEVWAGSADHPLGPWRDMMDGTPLISRNYYPGYHMIDAEAFIDEDGQAWLYWGSGLNWVNGRCWVVALDADMKTFASEPKDVTPEHYFEAPFMVKHSEQYYLMYSFGNTTKDTYQVRYAVSASPEGPFEEAPNSPILTTNKDMNVLSPGHHTVIEIKGQSYILYHRHSIPFDGEVLRQVCMDRLEWDDDGWIKKVEPTHAGPDILHQAVAAPYAVVTASSEHSSQTRATFADDSNYATLWKAAAEDASPWLQIDLGEVKEVSRQEIRPEYAWKDYRMAVQTSTNGKAWDTLEDFDGEAATGSPIIIDKPTNARYFRLQFEQVGDTVPGVFEWRVIQ